MKLLVLLLCGSLTVLAQQVQLDPSRSGHTSPVFKHVDWARLSPPDYPALARQAHIQSIVKISVTFRACTPDQSSIRVVSGHPMLAAATVQSVKLSDLECGDYSNATATIEYHFSLDSKCHDDKVSATPQGNDVYVRACVAYPPPLN